MPLLIPKLLEGLGLEKAKGAPTSGTKDVGKDDRDSLDVLDDAERKIVQSAAGLEQYIALDRPDICYSVKTALQGMAEPNKLMHLRVVRIARYLKSAPRLVWHYYYQAIPKTCDCYGDADFAARETQLRSTTGTVDCLGKHTLEGSSSTQSVRALSTGEAEFYAIVKAAASCLHTQAILLGFGVSLQAQVLSDATAGIGIASRQGCGKLKHLEVRWLWVQEKVAERAITLKKQKGETNGADLGTKYLPKPRMDFLLGLLALTLIQEAESTGLVLAGAAAMASSSTGFMPLSLACVLGLAMLLVGFVCGRRSATSGGTAATRRAAPPTTSDLTAEDRPTGSGLAPGGLIIVDGVLRRSSGVARPGGENAHAATSTAAAFGILHAVLYLSFLTAEELRLLLRSRGLLTSGDKQALSERLARSQPSHWQGTQAEFLGFMTMDEMKVLLRSRGQLVGGNKQALSTRLSLCAAAV